MSDPTGIELWIVNLDNWAADGLDADTLDPNDQLEARHLRTTDARCRLLARRSATRWILSGMLGVDPAGVRVERVCPTCGGTTHGRPSVDGSAIEFSVSSSGAFATIAVSNEPVGVDIEVVRSDLTSLGFALSARERRALDALPADQQGPAFLRLWTGKEAVLKAEGRSVVEGLATVDVAGLLTADRTTTAARTTTVDRTTTADHYGPWWVRQLSIGPASGVPVVVGLADRLGAAVHIQRLDRPGPPAP